MGTAITKRFESACPVVGNTKVFRVPRIDLGTATTDQRVPMPWKCLLIAVDVWSGKTWLQDAISGTRVTVEKDIAGGTSLFQGSVTDGSATGSKTSLTKQSSTKSDYLIDNGYINLELSPSITGASANISGSISVDLVMEMGDTIEY